MLKFHLGHTTNGFDTEIYTAFWLISMKVKCASCVQAGVLTHKRTSVMFNPLAERAQKAENESFSFECISLSILYNAERNLACFAHYIMFTWDSLLSMKAWRWEEIHFVEGLRNSSARNPSESWCLISTAEYICPLPLPWAGWTNHSVLLTWDRSDTQLCSGAPLRYFNKQTRLLLLILYHFLVI